MMQQGMTPGDPARVFEGQRVQLRSGDYRELLNNSTPRYFFHTHFDLSELEERFFVIAAAQFQGCVIRTRPGQGVLLVDRLGQDQPINTGELQIVGGGQSMPRILFSVLKCSATEGDRRIETTQTIDFSRLATNRVFVRNLIAVGDIMVGNGQTLVVDPSNCILLGDVVLGDGARIETCDGSALNWARIRQRHLKSLDFEHDLVFKQEWERAPVIVVPRGLDFREEYPNDITICDAVIGGDIHLRAEQSLTIGVSIQAGRRASVLIRGSVKCDGGSPQIIGGRGFHSLNRSPPSLGPITIGASVDRVG